MRVTLEIEHALETPSPNIIYCLLDNTLLICIVYGQFGLTAFDLAMGHGHVSTAGRLVFASKRVQDLTVEVCTSQLCWENEVNACECVVCVDSSSRVPLGM